MPDSTFAGLAFRNIGPANMSGRMADVEGVPGDPSIVYVGTASGGVWKTTNAGTTWTPVFDKQPVQSIGDLALEPGNPDVIYVGTGEGNVRNSVSFGNGVYKSTDGGKTWKHIGLADTRRHLLQSAQGAKKAAVRLVLPPHVATSPPSVRAQRIEPAVIPNAVVRVPLDVVSP